LNFIIYYHPVQENGKRKAGWIKVKPEYVAGVCDDLDLVVVGGYYGGRRGLITSFLLTVSIDS